MTREEEQLKNRLIELAGLSWQRQIPVFSDFLGLHEQNIYHSIRKEVSYAGPLLFGGYELAERQMLMFGSDALSAYGDDTAFGYEVNAAGVRDAAFRDTASGHQANAGGNPGGTDSENGTFGTGISRAAADMFPIRCVRMEPRDIRYAETLTHRDYLGAILNLGIDRAVTGDILIGDHAAFLFCHEKIADYICTELTRVRHTQVVCTAADVRETTLPRVEMKSIEGSVSSERMDALIPLAFGASRSAMKELCASGKVFRNGELVTDGSTHVKEGDIISVRTLGRFRYVGVQTTTKKGRFMVRLERFGG